MVGVQGVGRGGGGPGDGWVGSGGCPGGGWIGGSRGPRVDGLGVVGVQGVGG